jgi:ribosomal protein S18 acetylase RimI-like enzyme
MYYMHCMILRQFMPSDLASLKDLILTTIDTSYAGVYPPRAIEYFKQYHSDEQILDRAKNGYTVIGESQGEAIATGSIVEDHICAVFVMPSAQHQGLGRNIMELLEVKAQSEGFKEVNLHVSLPSRKFYERLGYQLSDEAYLDVGEGQRLDYRVGKKLLIAEQSQ